MKINPEILNIKPVLSVNIAKEQDLVTARQRARHLSALLGFNRQDQTRIATAVSEICRNAYEYASGGRLEFSLDINSRPQFLWIQITDRGRGIENIEAILSGTYVSSTGMGIGISGTSRLMEQFHLDSSRQGTAVRFGKAVPASPKPLHLADISKLCAGLAQQQTAGAAEELERQNQDLLQTLTTLRLREAELERRQDELARLNTELEETNRGVVALYAELDEKAAALRRADEMKSRFLSHVSHEFRTPVNSVIGLTRLLLQRVDGELSAEQEKQVLYIRDAAQQLAEMVNDLLDLAKVEAGKTEIRLTEVDVNQFLGSTRALMRPLAANDAVALIFDDVVPPFTFLSDESKLGQILRNLISNALKFTQDGEVRISAHMSPNGDHVLFQVTDSGIGIAAEDQERIFQEFTQLDNAIQKSVKGTGLGLPLSRRLAGLLGGTLTVESKPGRGSTFTLSLPAVPTEIPVSGQIRASLGESGSGTILLVDDEAASRYLVHRLFQGTHYHLVETTAAEAAERARFEAPALILLDLVMPDKSGFDVLDQLHSDSSTRHIPVVIHTSKDLTEGDAARLRDKILAILPKGDRSRTAALVAIRDVLRDPSLFQHEPEFTRRTT